MFPFPPPSLDLWQLIAVTGILGALLAGLFTWMLRFKPAVSPLFPVVWLIISVVVMSIIQGCWFNRRKFGPFDDSFLWTAFFVACIAPAIILLSRCRGNLLSRFLTACSTTAVALFLLFLSVVSTPAEGARRSICKNNLKQLGLAMHNYYDAHEIFPSQIAGEPSHSWRVDLLPWLEQHPLYQSYEQGEQWNRGANLPVSKTVVRDYSCPSMPHQANQDGMAFTSYALVIDPEGIYSPDSRPRKLTEISDGTSKTLLIAESCGQNLIWTDPHDIKTSDVPMGINLPGEKRGKSNSVFSGYHSNGSHVLMADGSARFLSQNTSPEVLKSLINANDRLPDDF